MVRAGLMAILVAALTAALPVHAQSTEPAPIAIRVGDFIFDGLAAGPEEGDPVILLHGFPQTSYSFRHQLRALAEAGYRAVAPDQRGYSPDARPPNVADYATPNLVGDVIGIADALGFDSFHLVGHDWGGGVAWITAASVPDRVRTLTILSTPHPTALRAALADPNSEQSRRSAYMNVFRAADAEQRFLADDAAYLREVLSAAGNRRVVQAYVDVLGTPEAIGAALNWYRAMALPSSPGGSAASPSLRVDVPTLYIFGAADIYFDRAVAEASAAYVNAPYSFEAIEGAGHWLMERNPERVNELLLAHLVDNQSPYYLSFLEVRPDIWFGYRRDPYRSPVGGNVTIIINEEDVVVVDAGSSPTMARQVLGKIRSLTDAPVSTLINTHGHEDHVLGNQVFVDAFPDVAIVARGGTREYLASGRVDDRVEDFRRNLSKTQEEGQAEIARVERRGLNGDRQLAAYLRRYYENDIYAVRNEYLDVTITPPNRTFEGRMVLERPGRTIELLDLGFGKAGSDVVVFIPEERLAIAGDIVTHPIPYGFARLQTEWLATLRRLVEIDFDDLVPGHGETLVDKDYVEQIIDLVEFELAEVGAVVRQGLDAESTAWEITFKEWARRFVGDDPIGLYFFYRWYVQPAVQRAHAELSERLR